MIAGLQKDDFAQDRSEMLRPSKKAKNQGDALATSGRPSSGKRASKKDEVRSDLKRQKTSAAAKQRKSIFGALTTTQMQKKVNFADVGLDLSAEKENVSVAASSDSESEGE